jgi:hypothetical protein
MDEHAKTGRTPVWAPPSVIQGKRLTESLRARAKESVWQRLAILENVADGRIGYRRISKRLGAEVAEPTPKDRIAAIRLIAEMAGVFAKDEKSLQAMGSDDQLATAMGAALRDPGVREWLMGDAELMAQLRGMVLAPKGSAEPPDPPVEEAETETGMVVHEVAPPVIGLLDEAFANWVAPTGEEGEDEA